MRYLPCGIVHYGVIAMLAALSFAVVGQASAGQGGARTGDHSQKAAAVFDASFHSLHDWTHMQSLSKWKGKTLVLNFWATWCKSCHYEIPELNHLYHKFADQNAVVVGIAVDNTDKVRDYVKKYGIDFPVLVGGDKALALSRKVGNKIGGLPYTIVITPNGRIAKTFLGTTKKGELKRQLSPILANTNAQKS